MSIFPTKILFATDGSKDAELAMINLPFYIARGTLSAFVERRRSALGRNLAARRDVAGVDKVAPCGGRAL